jgi:hypothetical protein
MVPRLSGRVVASGVLPNPACHGDFSRLRYRCLLVGSPEVFLVVSAGVVIGGAG